MTPPNDICHDLLFREGQTAAGEVTFTPRLVCADLKGSLGLLPQFGDLYDPPHKVPKRDSLLWDGELQAWLPDGYSQIFRIICVWPFGLLDYGSATLRCKI